MDTGILLTTGPKISEVTILEELMKQGLYEYRIHLGKANRDNFKILKNIIKASNNTGCKVETYLDIPSDRPRIDSINSSSDTRLYLKKGSIFAIVWKDEQINNVSNCVVIKIKKIRKYYLKIKELDRILIKDGSYLGIVIKKTENYMLVKCITDVFLYSMANCIWPDSNLEYDVINEEVFSFFEKIVEIKYIPDYFVLSFVKNAKQVIETKHFLEKYFKCESIKIVTKIETEEAISNLKEIVEVSDKILIGRGDLAPQIGFEKMPKWQNRIIEVAREYGVQCIVGTQFLEELAQNGRVYAPELNDIYYAVHQKVNTIMLAGEGAASDNAKKCIFFLKNLIEYEKGKEKIYMKTMEKKMKLMATAGPTLQTIEEFKKAIKRNVNEYRIHMGLRDRDFFSYFQNIRHAEKDLETKVEVYLDLPSTRPRITRLNENAIDVGIIVSVADSEVVIENADITLSNLSSIWDAIGLGDRIVFRDGLVVLKVIEKLDNRLITECIVSKAELKINGSSNFPDSKVEYEVVDSVDVQALFKMKQMDLKPDWIIVSFTTTAKQIKKVKKIVEEIWNCTDILIMAKVECQNGINNINDILEVADAIMIGRGDLLVNIEPEILPRMQLTLINRCREANKKVVVATQFFERFALTGVVNRAELSDVALACRAGCDSIMLAMETGNSRYNFECIDLINKIIEVEYEETNGERVEK